jgi:hypothetical protein
MNQSSNALKPLAPLFNGSMSQSFNALVPLAVFLQRTTDSPGPFIAISPFGI